MKTAPTSASTSRRAASPIGSRTHWRTDQRDRDKLEAIVAAEFDGPLDLVLDDASHLFVPTRTSFELLFPRLAPGGLYVIEDWAWEHWVEFHGRDRLGPRRELDAAGHPARRGHGLKKSSWVKSVHVREGFVAIERGVDCIGKPKTDFNWKTKS